MKKYPIITADDVAKFTEASVDSVYDTATENGAEPVCVVVVVVAPGGLSFRMKIAESAFAGLPPPDSFDPGKFVLKIVQQQLDLLPGVRSVQHSTH